MNVKDKQTGMKILVANLVYLLAIVVAILPFIALVWRKIIKK